MYRLTKLQTVTSDNYEYEQYKKYGYKRNENKDKKKENLQRISFLIQVMMTDWGTVEHQFMDLELYSCETETRGDPTLIINDNDNQIERKSSKDLLSILWCCFQRSSVTKSFGFTASNSINFLIRKYLSINFFKLIVISIF